MKRIGVARQTGRPAPLMSAARTFPARVESVPARAAAAEEKFRRAERDAVPAARFLRLPFASRTAYAIEFVRVVRRNLVFDDFACVGIFLKQPENTYPQKDHCQLFGVRFHIL